jgi:predicted CoA-substrate-specific enzyme activase
MRIGIDAGTKFLKIVHTDKKGSIVLHTYCQHFGNPEKEISRLLNTNGFKDIESIIFSGAHAGLLAKSYNNSDTADEISAIIESVNYLKNKCRYIVNVGAGSIKLIELDGNGRFASYSENSLCAAGTGSFLDEQMHRMSFTYEDIASIPFIKEVPDVATRCAVFAKSDLIHRQQEGYSREEMWSGLCRGVSATMLQSVFKGNIPSEDILFCGGLFLNPIVRMWIRDTLKNPFFNDNGHFFPAIGSLILNGKNKNKSVYKNLKNKKNSLHILETKLSGHADFTVKEEYFSNDLEVRIHKEVKNDLVVSIGIDIGSTSTKLVVIDAENCDVLIDIYGRTKGNPVEATKKLFNELKKIIGSRKLKIVSTATTGSGRKLVGKIIGADAIINEITAHFKGSSFFTPSIETIFEIGGQDSKYIRGQNGNVVDCNMNFVCAAGTGSFIEEQVQRLGFGIREIGDLVLGLRTPHTSDRCTVFMEQDINKLLRDGFSREEVLAGVISSIAKNYLNRVVGTRPITGKKIFFQGATARNRGIVAAFESILQKEIVVSPFCHVMGAFGAALISLGKVAVTPKFRGLDIFDQKIELEYSKCDKCANLCTITEVKLGGRISEYWGFMCGKETIEEKKRNTFSDHFKESSDLINNYIKTDPKNISVKKNKNTAGIPYVLSMHSHIVLWDSFLKELGFDVVLSGKSSRKLKEEGIRLSKSEFCFPVKLSLAHMKELAECENADFLFYPTTLSEKIQDNGMPRMLCPYVISYPSVLRETLNLSKEFISPCIDFRHNTDAITGELYDRLKQYNLSRNEISEAYNKALMQHKKYLKERYEYGQKLLQEFTNRNKTGIICIGRPYNLYDKIINLGLTERLNNNDNDVVVFPYDYLIDPDNNASEIPHMYWNYGEKILSISKKIRDYDNIYPVYFTNFSCGPDSFVLSRFEDIMRGKPYLIIELDEHGSETGYLTRIEAFMDVIMEKKRDKSVPDKPVESFRKSWKAYDKKIWFPPMFEIVPRFFAAAFRAYGFDAEALPVEDNVAFELGKNNTRGSECLPACITIGGFLKKLKEMNADPSKHALFMPTAEGPCRFGQYSTLHKSILKKNGMGDAEIFSPTSANSYMGMKGSLTRYLLDVVMASDLLSKRVYNIRPYEIKKGETDNIIEETIREMESGIEKKKNLVKMMAQALNKISAVPVKPEKKPLVGIVGEIYVRSNLFCNNNVIRQIEAAGGEAWLSPMSEWVIYTAWMEQYFNRKYKYSLFKKLGINIKTSYMINRMHSFEYTLQEFIPERTEPPIERILEAGRRYVPIEFEGEVILTIGRTVVFLEDGAEMVVNCAPFGCMPGNITTSIFHNIQKEYNKPVLNLFYDGESDVNRIISIYLNNINRTQSDIPEVRSNKHFSLTNSI